MDAIFKNSLYSSSNDIINGRKWVYEKKYLGSPLLTENYWPKANISYNGVNYTEKRMNYDVNNNEIIIYSPEKGKEKYVVLSNSNLSGFSFYDSLLNRNRVFEYLELPGIKGGAIYENVSVNKVSAYIKHVKKIEVRSAGGQGTFKNACEYFINMGSGYVSFRSKNQLVKILAKHTAEINKYIRIHNFKINNQHPENIIMVLNYFDALK